MSVRRLVMGPLPLVGMGTLLVCVGSVGANKMTDERHEDESKTVPPPCGEEDSPKAEAGTVSDTDKNPRRKDIRASSAVESDEAKKWGVEDGASFEKSGAGKVEAERSAEEDSKAKEASVSVVKSISPDCTDLCVLVTHFEEVYEIPRGLLLAIATAESLRRPWAVNTAQGSYYFKTLQAAADFVTRFERTYNRSVSIGYMQVNWHVHKSRFTDIAEAFSPYYNVRFAAELLTTLRKRHGSWEKAIGWYNPKGRKWNGAYFQKVRSQWTYRPRSASASTPVPTRS